MKPRLTAEEKKAKERFRLIQPENAHKIVGHPRYWSRELLRLLFAYVDELAVDEAVRAARVAEHLPVLVERIRVDDGVDSFESDVEKRSQLARAYIVRMHCARLLRRSESDRDRAVLELLLKQGVSRAVGVEYHRRQVLDSLDSDPDHAIQAVQAAVDLCDPSSPVLLGEVLLLRAHLRHRLTNASAADDLGAALDLADRTQRGRRLRGEASLLLEWDLARFGPAFEMLKTVSRSIKRARKTAAREHLSVDKIRLLSLSGIIHMCLGADRHAVRLLRKARAGLSRVGSAPIDFAVTSIDLCAALRSNDDFTEARDVQRDLPKELNAMESPRRLWSVLEPWLRAENDYQAHRATKLRCCSLRVQSP